MKSPKELLTKNSDQIVIALFILVSLYTLVFIGGAIIASKTGIDLMKVEKKVKVQTLTHRIGWTKIYKDMEIKLPIESTQHGYKQLWIRYKNEENKTYMVHAIINCAGKRVLMDAGMVTDLEDKVVEDYDNQVYQLSNIDNSTHWKRDVPETKEHTYFNYVCGMNK